VTPTVALVGATNHGAWHLRAIEPLHRAGRLRLVGVCDLVPVESSPDAPIPAGTPVFTDHRELLAAVRPDVAVIVTPPPTHLAIATDALRAGCDILLEKPPAPSLAEHRRLAALVTETGRVCQVGFQTLGSPALEQLLLAVHSGRLGQVTGVAAAGARQRDDAYYARARWAGKRTLDGRPTGDGALPNVFAHAVMNCLAVVTAAGGDPYPRAIEAERYRCRDIEVEDTACLRLVPRSGPTTLVAVTLCGERDIDGDIVVHGSAGRAVLEYPNDRLTLPGDAAPRTVPGRVLLLENLLDHRADPQVPLVAPLDRIEPFTAWLDAMDRFPSPVEVPAKYRVERGYPRRIEIPGVNDAVRAAAEGSAMFAELGVPWAVPAHRIELRLETAYPS
jgi:predicted dehydrogenase